MLVTASRVAEVTVDSILGREKYKAVSSVVEVVEGLDLVLVRMNEEAFETDYQTRRCRRRESRRVVGGEEDQGG